MSETRRRDRLRRPLVLAPLSLALAVVLANVTASTAAIAPTPPGWEVTFEDTFDGAALAPHWRPALPWGSRTNFAANGELQYYADHNVAVRDGLLRLRAQREGLGGMAYTSGAVHTAHAFAQAYGRFEIRMRVPKGQGLWSAFWLLHTPDGRSWPWPPEIDILEVLGHEPETIYMTTRHGASAATLQIDGAQYSGTEFHMSFRTVAIEWEPDVIIWYVDGIERFRSTEGVPTVPMYMIINLAVGGHWPGAPSVTTEFPAVYEIDYVRVYRRAEEQRRDGDSSPAVRSVAVQRRPLVPAAWRPSSTLPRSDRRRGLARPA